MGLLRADDPRSTAIAWGFVLVQLGLLLAILALPADDAWSLSDGARVATRALGLVGAAVLVVGLINLGRSLTPLPVPVPHGVLQTRGLYRWVRHPIYSGVMALGLGSALPSGNPWALAAALGLVGLFMAKARWEEDRLADRYPGYRDYAAGHPRFVPLWPFGTDRHPR